MRRTDRFSASVHRLFLISSDVSLLSLPRADDADDFFAMVNLPVCVHNQQNRTYASLDGDSTQRMPSLLAALILAVKRDQAIWVFEDQCRHFK